MAISANHPAARLALARGPGIAALLLAIVVALIAARIIWLLIPAPERPAIPAKNLGSVQTQNSSISSRNLDIKALVDRHLFGEAVVVTKEDPREDVPVDAPDTKLNLKLTGVVLSDVPELSRAFITTEKKEEKFFAIEDEVARSTTLHAIYVDHVILDRNGRYEALRIEKVKGLAAQLDKRPPPSPSDNTELAGDTAAKLASLRTELLSNPQKAGDLIRIQPVNKSGTFQGYRVYPGKDRSLFREVGLRSGDLIKSVNGTSLDDPSKGFALLSELSAASQIELTLERRGNTQNITVNLGQ